MDEYKIELVGDQYYVYKRYWYFLWKKLNTFSTPIGPNKEYSIGFVTYGEATRWLRMYKQGLVK
jgi:hypothetical protein